MEEKLKRLFDSIKNDPQNSSYTKEGIDPLYYANPAAKILIVGQAPGKKAQNTKKVWNDQSGIRLRKWLDVTDRQFYESGKIAVLPMDFYYPGKGKHGDLPPRSEFAAKWHPQLLKEMPNIKLTILVGNYAQRKYLGLKGSVRLTEVVHAYEAYLPKYFPIVHPSALNGIWLKRNSWFEQLVVPELQKRVQRIMDEN
ncbi:uracil-DNA glycosylase family protein [Liquorilactobacillus oeni]|uniref:Uracil dna glycosylase superfamily protein n=1 Tax=Liquorilactobacillus oeni DSM 19972 TaxID=1423777 RepID=A0A0R1MJJ6_9LACO|nr:uracil-DNA glycosylase family protein [Liquorilactobacillus oeni]KRL05525.1 uracil dna glycosylase superfamily protein [Liquorilactobacillus oeni DSM 19972]